MIFGASIFAERDCDVGVQNFAGYHVKSSLSIIDD